MLTLRTIFWRICVYRRADFLLGVHKASQAILCVLARSIVCSGGKYAVEKREYVRKTESLFGSPCDASLGQVVWRHFDRNLVSGKDANVIHSELSGNVGENCVMMS